MAQRSAGQIAFETEDCPGQKGALRENDSRCRSAVNEESPLPRNLTTTTVRVHGFPSSVYLIFLTSFFSYISYVILHLRLT